jgi:hypothetical protein
MIQKRKISTFAVGVCLLALMLLSASPAKAFTTTDPKVSAAYDRCLTKKYVWQFMDVIKCFEEFRTTYSDQCLVDETDIINSAHNNANILKLLRRCNYIK